MKIRCLLRKADTGTPPQLRVFSETRNTRATAFSRRPIPIHSLTATIIMEKRICTLPEIITKPSSAMKTSRPQGEYLNSTQKKRTSHQTVRNISNAMLFQEKSSAENVAALSNAGFITQQERATSRGAATHTYPTRIPALCCSSETMI